MNPETQHPEIAQLLFSAEGLKAEIAICACSICLLYGLQNNKKDRSALAPLFSV